jgi:hypothetical protein
MFEEHARQEAARRRERAHRAIHDERRHLHVRTGPSLAARCLRWIAARFRRGR